MGLSSLVYKFAGLISDAESKIVRVDASTHSIQTIDYVHHEVHAENAFVQSAFNTGIASGSFLGLTVITPDTTKWLHTVFVVWGIFAYVARVYEGATVNVAGAATIAYNRNRNSAVTSGATLRLGDTFTDKGTVIWQQYIGAGNKSGGGAEGRTEFILDQNQTYLFELESKAASNILSGALDWYEHTDKD